MRHSLSRRPRPAHGEFNPMPSPGNVRCHQTPRTRCDAPLTRYTGEHRGNCALQIRGRLLAELVISNLHDRFEMHYILCVVLDQLLKRRLFTSEILRPENCGVVARKILYSLRPIESELFFDRLESAGYT